MIAFYPASGIASNLAKNIGGPIGGANSDLVILVGQSNAQGVAPEANAPTAYSSAFDGSIIYNDSASAFQNLTLSNNEGNTASTFGPEIPISRGFGDNAMAKYAVSGTSLAVGWKPTPTFGPQLTAALAEIDEAVAAAPSQLGSGVLFKAIYWVQGEADSTSLANSNAYEANLRALISVFRDAYGEDIPFIISKVNPDLNAGTYPYVGTVRAAQDAVAADTDGVYTVDVVNLETFDGVHYDAISNVDLGAALAQASLDGENKVAFPSSIKNASIGSSFSVAGQEGVATSMRFSRDRSKCFVAGGTNTTIYQYNVTLNGDGSINTFVYSGISYNPTENADSRVIEFSDDGLYLYAVGVTSDDIDQYLLTAPWDISAPTYTGRSLNVSLQSFQTSAIRLVKNGTQMFVVDSNTDKGYLYNLSTPYLIDTGVYAGSGSDFDFSGQDTSVRGFAFDENGYHAFMAGDTNNTIYQYTVRDPFDTTTMSYSGVSFPVGGTEGNPSGLEVWGDVQIMQLLGFGADAVTELNL